MGAILKISTHRAQAAFAALAAFAAACGDAATASPTPTNSCLLGATDARAMSIADARSVTLADGRILRLAGIESFALLTPQGDEAEAALQRRLAALVSGRDIRVRILAEAADRYGRLPALIAVGDDGPSVQETLAGEGLAVAFATGDPVACFDAILAAETEARRSRQGFWNAIGVLAARPEALRPRSGRFAIFEGRVVSVGTRRARTYLNFGLRWSEDVTVQVEGGHRDRFGGQTELAELAGRRLRIRGFVEERAGPVVTVSSPMQIEVLGEPGPLNANRDGDTP